MHNTVKWDAAKYIVCYYKPCAMVKSADVKIMSYIKQRTTDISIRYYTRLILTLKHFLETYSNITNH